MNNDATFWEVAIAMVIALAAVAFCMHLFGTAVECSDASCPAGQVPRMVKTYSGFAECTCVLR